MCSAKRPRDEHRARRTVMHVTPLGVVAEIETPPPPAWRGESPVDGGRLSERTACIAAAHALLRHPRAAWLLDPPDGPSATRMSAPRACRTQPSLTKGRRRRSPARHQHRCDCMRQPVRRHPLPAATVSACRSGWNVQSFCRLAAIQRMSVEVAARRDEFKLRIKTWARRQ
jgi:hypothetical protein